MAKVDAALMKMREIGLSLPDTQRERARAFTDGPITADRAQDAVDDPPPRASHGAFGALAAGWIDELRRLP